MQDDLWKICDDEYFPRNLGLRSDKTRFQYKLALADFRLFLHHAPTLADLDDDVYACWLKWLIEYRKLAEITANERAGRVKSLWNWLARRGRVTKFPTIGRVPVPETQPLAWSQEELRLLFDAALQMPGMVGDVRACVWWATLLAWLWCTGERLGATLGMTWEHVDLLRGVAMLPAAIRKGTRKAATYHIWPDVVQMLWRLKRPEGEVFPLDCCIGTYYHRYDRLLKLAGLPGGRRRKSQAMRVSHATWTEAFGGDATKRLMHSNRATTRQSYIDPRFIPDDSVNLFRPWDSLPPDPPREPPRAA